MASKKKGGAGRRKGGWGAPSSSSSLLLSCLELSDTTIYEPQIRALLGTASHFCQVVVLKLRTAGRMASKKKGGRGQKKGGMERVSKGIKKAMKSMPKVCFSSSLLLSLQVLEGS